MAFLFNSLNFFSIPHPSLYIFSIFQQLSPLFAVRTSRELYVHYRFALNDQCILNVKGRLCSNMLNLVLIIISQHIESQAIRLRINNLLKLMLNLAEFCRIEHAFKD